MTIRSVFLVFGILMCCAWVSASSSGGSTLDRWFESGRCGAFDARLSGQIPFARNDNEHLIWNQNSGSFEQFARKTQYLYDPRQKSALRVIGRGEGFGSYTWRFITTPPPNVTTSDLSKLRTTSNIRLGTRAATVLQKLGKPRLVQACGVARYYYLFAREVGGDALDFTIAGGRVVEIFQAFGD
ncbi:MAG: hypothetical protein JO033_01115 [Acidobacteriaceae bacterium]|nr:hypothetical protein [Acidobacteriaceae bacterium]